MTSQSEIPLGLEVQMLSGQKQEPKNAPPEFIRLNIRGSHVLLDKDCFSKYPECKLAKLSPSDPQYISEKDEYYFNRNPTLFNCVVDFLVDGENAHFPNSWCPELMHSELVFWGFGEDILAVCCWNRLQEAKEQSDALGKVQKEWRSMTEAHMENVRTTKLGSKSKVSPLPDPMAPLRQFFLTRETLPLRDRVWLFLEDPDYSKSARIWSWTILLFILLSVIGLVLESIPFFRVYDDSVIATRDNQTDGKLIYFLINSESHVALRYFELACVLVFTSELVLRYGVCRNKFVFYRRFLNVIDLLAILPAWLMLVIRFVIMIGVLDSDLVKPVLYSMGCFRFLRTFRLFKIMKHYRALKVIYLAMVASYKEFLLLVLLLGITATIYGHLIYFTEIYADNFDTIPLALWWAVITMTTVGYGDFYPRTWMGYLVGGFCAIAGILVIAMPVPIIVNNFNSYYKSAEICTRLESTQHKTIKDELKQAENLKEQEKKGKEETAEDKTISNVEKTVTIATEEREITDF